MNVANVLEAARSQRALISRGPCCNRGGARQELKEGTLPRVLEDTLAERLRRRPAKPMGSPRVGSNPTGVGLQLEALEVDVQKRGCSGN